TDKRQESLKSFLEEERLPQDHHLLVGREALGLELAPEHARSNRTSGVIGTVPGNLVQTGVARLVHERTDLATVDVEDRQLDRTRLRQRETEDRTRVERVRRVLIETRDPRLGDLRIPDLSHVARLLAERRDVGRTAVDPLETSGELVHDRVDDVRGVAHALFDRIARGEVVVRDSVEDDAIVRTAGHFTSDLRVVGVAAVEVDVGTVADAA